MTGGSRFVEKHCRPEETKRWIWLCARSSAVFSCITVSIAAIHWHACRRCVTHGVTPGLDRVIPRHARACSQVYAGCASLPVRASTSSKPCNLKDVGDRDKPGHDDMQGAPASRELIRSRKSLRSDAPGVGAVAAPIGEFLDGEREQTPGRIRP